VVATYADYKQVNKDAAMAVIPGGAGLAASFDATLGTSSDAIVGEDNVAAEADDQQIGCDLLGDSSFTASTRVLLASGKTVPIATLKPGDKVLATNTTTGKTTPETITAVWYHHDTNLYNLTIHDGTHTATIHTTTNHLFWNQTTHHWAKAATLTPGTRLHTPSGVAVTVTSSYAPSQHTGWMWDLTIPGNNDHDFYVSTVAASVLVHNCDLDSLSASGGQPDPADAGVNLTRTGRALAKASEVFGSTSGGSSAINEAGQNALDDILTDPGTFRGTMSGGNFADGPVFISPDGIAAVFGPDGVFQYFGRMAYP
jgi:Pretoxin HINT domain